jgi:hypothetical protein
MISYQNDGKYSTADCRKAGKFVSEYSNAWIDMRHDNARNLACAVAREYFADSAFVSVDSFGDGWLRAGQVIVFVLDGSMQRLRAGA